MELRLMQQLIMNGTPHDDIMYVNIVFGTLFWHYLALKIYTSIYQNYKKNI